MPAGLSRRAARGLAWREVSWPRPLEVAQAAQLVAAWATDQRSPVIVLEARASQAGIRYLLGSAAAWRADISASLTSLLPGARLTPAKRRQPVQTAARVRASTRHRPVLTDDIPAAARIALAALTRVRRDEELVLQVILGPRRIPLAVPSNSPSASVRPWYQVAWHGNGGRLDTEKRAALRAKVAEHGYACTVRLGVCAPLPRRRRVLVLGLLAALRTSESPGLQLSLAADSARRLNAGMRPRLLLPGWSLRLGVHEVLAMTAWPVGSDELPGQPPLHPRLLPPDSHAARAGRVVGTSLTPGGPKLLRLPMTAQLRHLHVLGPTGTGKSTLMAQLVVQDLAAGHGAAVIDPKGDLVSAVLEHVPDDRQGDIVVLDPSDTAAPVGLNPLAGSPGRRPEVVADALLGIFHQLWADSWGPRMQDILHASLLTLGARNDASLVMLPLLLTNAGFRRSLVQHVHDPVALGPFWAWYEQLSTAERATVIAPVMNKLRAFLLRPSMRAVLGQVHPRFAVRQVFTDRKVLLVNLSKGLVGPEAAALLGSLVVAELWQALLERAAVPPRQRHPVHLVIDEVQDYLRLPLDLADALAQARSLGGGFTLAHQYLGQLPTSMRTALLANAHSRVCFQLAPDDAAAIAHGHPELEPADLTALGAYSAYASLLAGDRRAAYASIQTMPLPAATSNERLLRARSRQRYGQPLDEIEAGFARLLTDAAPVAATGRRPRRSP